MRKWNNIFWAIVLVVFAIFFIRGINTGLQRSEANRELCSEHNMSSFTVNRSATVLCVDDKGQVFYLRNKVIE